MAKLTASRETPALEWVVGVLGALVFCVVLAVLVMSGLRGADAPPDIEARVERVTPVRGGYVIEFVAENSGDRTAAGVEIVAELGGETAGAQFDYLPPRSERRGGVFLQRDPRAGGLTLRAQGYADP